MILLLLLSSLAAVPAAAQSWGKASPAARETLSDVDALKRAAALSEQGRRRNPNFAANLMTLDGKSLKALFGMSPAGPMPDGKGRGRGALLPGTAAGSVTSVIALPFWQGKVFKRAPDGKTASLLNLVAGMYLIPAEVRYEDSWHDGKPCIVIDYEKTPSPLFRWVRDEIREVAPGVYLGFVFDKSDRRFIGAFFALDFNR